MAFDRVGQNRIIQICVRMEATLKPFYSQNASFHPILVLNPDTFFGGWMDCRDGSYSVIPHALLVTLVAQRPFRICSATRWIRGVSLSRYSNDLRVTITRCRYKGRELQWGKSVSAGRCRYKGGVVIWGVVIWVCVQDIIVHIVRRYSQEFPMYRMISIYNNVTVTRD